MVMTRCLTARGDGRTPAAGDEVLTMTEDCRITILRSVRALWGIKPGDTLLMWAEGRIVRVKPLKDRRGR